jgi:hypothetical protein
MARSDHKGHKEYREIPDRKDHRDPQGLMGPTD